MDASLQFLSLLQCPLAENIDQNSDYNRLDANMKRRYLSADDRDSSDYNRRMTMKTRVAIRDKSPHRFEIVPLRDARFMCRLDETRVQGKGPDPHVLDGQMRHYSTLPAESDMSNHSPRGHIVSNDEILGLSQELVTSGKCLTPFRPKVEFDYSQRVTDILPSSDTLCDASLRGTPAIQEIPPEQNLPASFLSLRSMLIQDSTSSSTVFCRQPLMSSSLGATTRPMTIGMYGDSTVAHRHRKHTKTLSENESLSGNLKHNDELWRNRSHNLCKDSGLSKKRHAIYTQSLYVPFNELSEGFKHPQIITHSGTLDLSCNSTLGLFQESSQVRQKKVADVASASNLDTGRKTLSQKGSCDVFLELEALAEHTTSTYPIPSVYHADHKNSTIASPTSDSQTIAPKVEDLEIKYPPTILKILADLDVALREWNFHP